MNTKKKYIAPVVSVIYVESTPLMSNSMSDYVDAGDPFSAPAQQSTLGTSEYFNSWDDSNGDVEEQV